MLEDLRKITTEQAEELPVPEKMPAPKPNRTRNRPLLGMTAGQRLIISILLLIMILVVGSLCLLATGRIVLP